MQILDLYLTILFHFALGKMQSKQFFLIECQLLKGMIKVHSPNLTFKLPSVIALKDYITPQRQPAFTRFNVFLRDNFTCQYCTGRFPASELTFDHLVPKCLNGKTTWENVVSACTSCNLKKGRKLIQNTDMKLFKKPLRPSSMQLQNNGRNFPPNFLHETWRDYLYWDTELEN